MIVISVGSVTSIDPSHESHNAPLPYPTMHHVVTEMCTCVHISVTKWCIVGYLMHCWICEVDLLIAHKPRLFHSLFALPLQQEICLSLGLCKGTESVSDQWKIVEILTGHANPKSITAEAIPTYTHYTNQPIRGHVSRPTASPTAARLGLWSSLSITIFFLQWPVPERCVWDILWVAWLNLLCLWSR